VTAAPGDAKRAARPAALEQLRASVEAYYTRKVRTFGATPLGVDWPSTPSLELRLVQLLKVCDFSAPFALNDFGCGYAAALDLIERRWPANQIDYLGVDLSADMIAHARRRWHHRPGADFIVGNECGRAADYSIASGVFNVRLDHSTQLWTAHIQAILTDLHRSSRRGFAVNFMLPAAAAHAPELYGSQPDSWVDYCETVLGRSVELVQGYGMPEYSLLVR
jgi:SAM-dependent methyltransferase